MKVFIYLVVMKPMCYNKNMRTRIIDHIAHCPQHGRHHGISDQEIDTIEWWLAGAINSRITQRYICDTITLKPYNDVIGEQL